MAAVSRSGYKARKVRERRRMRELQKHAIPGWCVIRFQPEFTTSKKTLLGPDEVAAAKEMDEDIPDLPRTPLRNLVPGIEDLIVRTAIVAGYHDTDIFADGEVDFYVKPYKRRRLFGDAHPLRVIHIFVWKGREPLGLMSTAAHELRHVGQFHRHQYYDAHPDPERNWDEPAEEDARTFAAKVVGELAPEFTSSEIARYLWIDRMTEKDRAVWVVRRGLSGTIVKGGKHRSYEEASDFIRTL